MIIYVIGLGSMGRRRIGLIKEINPNAEILGIDFDVKRCKQTSQEFDIVTFDSIDKALGHKKAECAFVCTSPISHSKIIAECLQNDLHVFTELNLIADGYDSNSKLAVEREKVLFLSSTFLYRQEIQYIEKRVKSCITPPNYIYHVGQYLPDWHPWENYKDFFVGDKRTNGCREIFAIELPWIVSTFGKIVDVDVDKKNSSLLNIDYPDTFFVRLKHENGNAGNVVVDVVSRKPVRNLEVFGEELHLTWGGKIDSIADYDIETKTDRHIDLGKTIHKDGYADFISENPYRDEIIDFFDVLNAKRTEGKWSFEKDKEVLAIIDKIEGV